MEYKIDRNDKRALYIQIRDCILEAINNGELNEGDRLPSVVGFAKEFGVTQATVNRALEELSEQGWITSHVGRGTFVSNPGNLPKKEMTKSQEGLKLGSPLDGGNTEFVSAARKLRMGIAKSLDVLDVFLKKPDQIHLFSGVPDSKIADPGIMKKMMDAAYEKFGQEILQGYSNPQGLLELREKIAERYNAEGIKITAEHVLITSGSQQAVSIMAQDCMENRRRIICETPSYTGIFNAFSSIGHWVETVPRDFDGPIISKLKKFEDGTPSLLYLCPELHNPMGTDLETTRADELSEWAKNNDSLLFADEIFKDLRFEGKKPVSLLERAGTDNCCTISSLSKSFMCGLRVGWMIGSPEKIKSIISLKRSIDISCPTLMQAVAYMLLESGEYDNHLIKAREHYKLRRDTALEALGKYMPDGVKWTVPNGGFHMWCELPEGYSSIALFLHAVNKGVAVRSGPQFDLDHRFLNGFNLGYGSLEPEKIHEGIELLADAVKELLKTSPEDSGLSGLGGLA